MGGRRLGGPPAPVVRTIRQGRSAGGRRPRPPPAHQQHLAGPGVRGRPGNHGFRAGSPARMASRGGAAGGQPAPRFALETVVRIKLEADGEASTRVVMESRQRPADPDRERAMRSNSEYLAKMLETSLERLEMLVTKLRPTIAST